MPKAPKLTPYFPTEIKLAEDGSVPNELQALRVGKFSHPKYGDFQITPQMLSEMKKNFDNKVRRVDPAIDYKHENHDVAAGWPKAMELKDGGKSLWFTDIQWTPAAQKVLADKEFRYFSPEFVNQYTDPETNKTYNNVIFGGGLTNRPFIKDMQPVVKLGEENVALADTMQACIAGWIPELIAKGHTQDEATAIAYSKCGEKKLAELSQDKLHQEQKTRSDKYGIEVSASGALTPPSGSPTNEVNYKYPIADKAHAANAHARFKQAAGEYSQDSSKAKVFERIVRKELSFGIEPAFDPKDALDALLPSDLKDQLSKKKLSETNKGAMYMDPKDQKIAELEKEVADLKAQLDKAKGGSMQMTELETSNKKLSDEVKALTENAKVLTEKIALVEKEKEFTILLTEGKACVAQKEAFLKGDMKEFINKAQKINLSETGNGGDNKTTNADPHDKIISLAEEKMKADKSLDLDKAVRLVLTENKELAAQAN